LHNIFTAQASRCSILIIEKKFAKNTIKALKTNKKDVENLANQKNNLGNAKILLKCLSGLLLYYSLQTL